MRGTSPSPGLGGGETLGGNAGDGQQGEGGVQVGDVLMGQGLPNLIPTW